MGTLTSFCKYYKSFDELTLEVKSNLDKVTEPDAE